MTMNENRNDLIDNPFINNNELTYLLDETKIKLNEDNIWKYYKHIFIISIKNNKNISEDIYHHRISEVKLNDIYNNLILHKTTIKLLKNKNHFNNLIIRDKDFLEKFNFFEY